MTRRVRWWWASALCAGLGSCAGRSLTSLPPVPALPRSEIAVSLYLIGDAGAPGPQGEPVLEALRRDLAAAPGQRAVVFLGDNIYPRGLPAPGARDRAESERRLAAQVEVVVSSSATGYFVLGNHDWARQGKGGWDAARRQSAFVDSMGKDRVSVRPGNGCPGPSVVDLGRRLRLVLLDSQWWLHPGAKPTDPASACPTDTETEIIDSIRGSLREAGGRLVVVGAHHPLATGGVHGGYFGWKDHLFPLLKVAPWLWIPLPLIGSLYPAARQHGISSQDLGSPAYQRFISGLRRAFSGAQPALYAAGHEHNLQVIKGGPAQLELVSGGGIYGHADRVVPIEGSLYASDASGFARLDVPSAGRARLGIFEVDSAGDSRETFSAWVE